MCVSLGRQRKPPPRGKVRRLADVSVLGESVIHLAVRAFGTSDKFPHLLQLLLAQGMIACEYVSLTCRFLLVYQRACYVVLKVCCCCVQVLC